MKDQIKRKRYGDDNQMTSTFNTKTKVVKTMKNEDDLFDMSYSNIENEIKLQLLAEQIKFKRNKEYIYNKNLKKIFYYFRDGLNRPIVTVCVLYDKHKNICCRGISICSENDIINKENGRDYAEDRAVQAHVFKFNNNLIRKTDIKEIILSIVEANPELNKNLLQFGCKSEYNVTLTDFEKSKLKI